MVFTATATKETQTYIVNKLELKNPTILEVNPDRPNIFYSKKKRKPSTETYDDLDELLDLIVDEIKTNRDIFPLTIVYTDLDTISYCFPHLQKMLGDLQYDGSPILENCIIAQYHRHSTVSVKDLIIKDICSETPKIKLVLATIALGMGLNSPHIRRIIHFKPPSSLEKYMQEAGRAGRDGKPAVAILYWNGTDIRGNRPGIKRSLQDYCKSEHICLRSQLLAHLGFELDLQIDRCKCCSVCELICKCDKCKIDLL